MKVAAIGKLIGVVAAMGIATVAHAHGDVTPQVVDTHELKQLGADWLGVNPYRDNKKAIQIGSSAFNQNCARCHGLEAVSGGIAPDLRKLDLDPDTDVYFRDSVRRGKIRNGVTYMPPFEGVLNQEAIWAIKSYLESRRSSLQ
ncbi:MAG: cytochrome c-550 PedF [Rhodocyclaceae bacterium]|nr:cytochrome c-550 PedF [Rhodocyclaceae bacterium]MBX3670621.1 cytochrome c-550 PedF [Rhodocyclaceae bacterium]